jgi:hypothetical protein
MLKIPIEKQLLHSELRVRGLSDAINYNRKTTIVPWTQGPRALRWCKLQYKSNYCTLNSGSEGSQMLQITIEKQLLYPELRVRGFSDVVNYNRKATIVPWTQGSKAQGLVRPETPHGGLGRPICTRTTRRVRGEWADWDLAALGKRGGDQGPPELRVRGLSDAVNYNRKTTIVPWTQGLRALRCCKLL